MSVQVYRVYVNLLEVNGVGKLLDNEGMEIEGGIDIFGEELGKLADEYSQEVVSEAVNAGTGAEDWSRWQVVVQGEWLDENGIPEQGTLMTCPMKELIQ